MNNADDNATFPVEPETREDRSAAPHLENVIMDIAHLSHVSSGASQFFTEALALIAKPFASPYAVIEVRHPSEVISNHWHHGPTDPSFWSGAVQEVLTEALANGNPVVRTFHARDNSVAIAVISGMIRDIDGNAVGAIAMVVPSETTDQARSKLRALKSLAAVASSCGGLLESAVSSGANDDEYAQILQQSMSYESIKEFAFAIVNNLCSKANCEQVALGIVRGKKVHLEAVSAFDNLPKRSPGVSKIRETMEECLDMGEPMVYQQRQQWTDQNAPREYRLHKQWHEATGQSAVASIPLRSGDNIVAIVSLRRSSAHPFKPKHIQAITELLEPYASALGLVSKATRSVVSHAASSFTDGCRKLVKPGHWAGKALLGGLALLCLWIAFGTMPHSVTVTATVIPELSRHLSSSHSAILLDAPVVAGDHVRKGQILCSFDTTELQLQRKRVQAELGIASVDEQQTLAKSSPVDAAIARVRQKKLRADIAIIDHMIALSVLRAPFNGTVISGDLRKQIGSQLPAGQPLYQIASDEGWSLKLDVPQSRIASVRTGLLGNFASSARPEKPQSFRITRLLPACTQSDGNNVFVVEGQLNSPPEWIRPGMVGSAKVHAGKKPVWWVLSHRMTNYLRLRFWL